MWRTHHRQCDQMAGLFCNILTFSTITVCPIAFKIGQSKLKSLANAKRTLSKWPKFLSVVVKWRNFAKSGHTFTDQLPKGL